MEKFTILKGLPPYGDPPEQFTSTGQGTHKEGFVVEFHPVNLSKWVGNFQRGLGNYDCVLEHPDPNFITVVAGGDGLFLKEKSLIIFNNMVDLIILDHRKKLLKTERISWDGIQGLRLDGDYIVGKSWDPMRNKWIPFKVCLNNLDVTGGSYSDYIIFKSSKFNLRRLFSKLFGKK
jgi:hypothetical protein